MIQLQILSGRQAGTSEVAHRFPYYVGRSNGADLCLEEDGVWDQHFELHLDLREGFILSVQPNALTTVNGHPVEQVILRNGDLIEIGALKMRFWLGETRQIGLRFREWLTWTGLVLLCAVQIGLVYWLLKGE